MEFDWSFEVAEWVSYLYLGLQKRSVPGEEKEIPVEILKTIDEHLRYS